jgi:hypothetical protein
MTIHGWLKWKKKCINGLVTGVVATLIQGNGL